MADKTVIIIAGPTASGKTALAIHLALHYSTEIISADSRQCYRELNIGVARPSTLELNTVPHHFIADHSVVENITAATFEKIALATCDILFQKHDVIVMCGGTGLYLKAFMHGLDTIPEIDIAIREPIRAEYDARGAEWLKQRLQLEDPLFFTQGEMQNPHRMMRALEVVRSSGQSILRYQSAGKKLRPFRILAAALNLPRDILVNRIDSRVEGMIVSGLEEEVRGLEAFRHLNALQTVGYQELFEYFDGRITKEAAITQIKQHTRQYAKRQMTWFRKQQEFTWLPPDPAHLVKWSETH